MSLISMRYKNGIVWLIVYVKCKSKLGLLVQTFACSPVDDDQVIKVLPAFAQLRKVAVTVSP